MLEEDILAGIADESSCYFSEESEEEQAYGRASNNITFALNINQIGQTIQNDLNIIGQLNNDSNPQVIVNNSSLNVLRCIGRYLQMCKLLHSISPYIVSSMTELIDFYTYVVHDVFGRDMVSRTIPIKTIKKPSFFFIACTK